MPRVPQRWQASVVVSSRRAFSWKARAHPRVVMFLPSGGSGRIMTVASRNVPRKVLTAHGLSRSVLCRRTVAERELA